jgi:hypothetical protein
MKAKRFVWSLPAVLCAMSIFPVRAQSPAAKAARQSGQGHYYRLKLVKIMDEQGFGEPVEVARLLIPADWHAEGGVHWDDGHLGCPLNIIKLQFRAVAPDGVTGIEFSPGYMWQAASDPMMQQIIRQQAAAGTGCDAGPVSGAVEFLKGSVIPRLRPGARVVGAEPLPAVKQAKEALLAQSYGPLVRAGYVRGYKADAASVEIAYTESGQPVSEWLSATVLTIVSPSANTAALMQGQMNQSATTFSMVAEPVFTARAHEGKFDKKLVATIIASTRPNPQYQAAVTQFLTNMGKIAQRGAMDRARIWHDASEQISATINETYQRQQAVQDRAAQQFSEAIRGIETYVNPRTGTNVELTGGYDNAWVNNRGEYLLSDSPGFNPAVQFQENWTQLKKAE